MREEGFDASKTPREKGDPHIALANSPHTKPKGKDRNN